jgi:hypothetical protein
MKRYMDNFSRGKYYKNVAKKFTPITDYPIDYMDPTPSSYPTSTTIPPNYPMKEAMENVLGPTPGTRGKWFLSKCNFPESGNNETEDKYFPIFWRIGSDELPIEEAGYAAPCPPFCEGETGSPKP